MIPVHVLLSRLAHTLDGVALSLAAERYDQAQDELAKAQELLTQIQGVA